MHSGAGKKIFWSCPSTFFGSKSTISRFGERLRDGQYSFVSLLFAVLLLTVPPCPSICKKGVMFPPCPMESAPLIMQLLTTLHSTCNPHTSQNLQRKSA